MEIIKLGDVCNVTSGKKPNKNLHKYLSTNYMTGLPFPKQTDIKEYLLKKTKLFFDKNYFHLTQIEDGKGLYFLPDCSFKPFLSKISFCMDPHIWKISTNEKLYEKYLFYWLIKNNNTFMYLSSGTTLKFLTKETFKKINIFLPTKKQQEQIINIIEPKEKLFIKYNNLVNIESIEKFKKTWSVLINIIEPFEKILYCNDKKLREINSFSKKIISKKFNKKLIFENINFIKGVTNVKFKFSTNNKDIPFVNVSAINNKINKYINWNYSKYINVYYGDVILSLDGNPGLVNNFLFGINGYGFKLTSKIYKNFEIYFSLLHEENQKIIKNFSTGTTILHAGKAKNHLFIFDFKNYKEILKYIYLYEINLKSLIFVIKKIINNLINLYIN